MKSVPRFLLRMLSVTLIVLSFQGSFVGVNAEIGPIAPPNTQSPRDTYNAFMTNMDQAYELVIEGYRQSKQEPGLFQSAEVKKQAARAEKAMERAIGTLNLQEVSPVIQKNTNIESALLLREILDRIEKPRPEDIPDLEAVKTEGIKRWEIPNTAIAIVQISDEGWYKNEFRFSLFSEETLKRLELWYGEVKHLPYQEGALEGFYEYYISTPGSLLPPKWSKLLPGWSKKTFWDQTIWQWGSLLLLLSLASAMVGFIYRELRSPRNQANSKVQAWEGLILPTSIVAICFVSKYMVTNIINITGSTCVTIVLVLETILYCALAWLSFMFFNAVGRTIIASSYFDENHLLEATIVRNAFRIWGVVTGASLLYLGGNEIGIPTQALVASLGVGGLAISFGVQPYLKNLVGGITLFAHRSAKIGEFCEFGGVTGTIEDIGLNTTSVRTLGGSLVIIPNSVVSETQVVNYSRCERRLMNFTIGLRYETERQQLLDVMDKIRSWLEQHSMIVDERVRFIDFGDSSLDIEVFAYVMTTSYAEFLEIKETCLIEIIKIVEAVGTEFAFPSQTLYFSRDRAAGGGDRATASKPGQ